MKWLLSDDGIPAAILEQLFKTYPSYTMSVLPQLITLTSHKIEAGAPGVVKWLLSDDGIPAAILEQLFKAYPSYTMSIPLVW